MFWNKKKSGIVNVKMVITEEKILSNIGKIQKLIDPASKKTIIQLDDDTYFKDLIESIKMYLIEYPKKKNFPASVYKAAYGLVEYATNQFEENTKQIEELIRQREKNISLSSELKELLNTVTSKDKDWKVYVKNSAKIYSEDIAEALGIIGRAKVDTSNNYKDAVKLVQARITNLESNLHIEIDMERIEDKSKALSYIGIEVADALKVIPTPVDYNKEETTEVQNAVEEKVQDVTVEEQNDFINETRIEVKPSLWSRIKNSRIARTISYIFKIRIVLDMPALPEGRGEQQ